MSKPESFTKEQKLSYLMTTTGKSKIACDIALQLAGNDVDRAIDRMKESYPKSLNFLDSKPQGS